MGNLTPISMTSMSLSARRAWIEMVIDFPLDQFAASLSARRAWIEIVAAICTAICRLVALRKESVDRNRCGGIRYSHAGVALRKESVDRNIRDLLAGCGVLSRSPQGERG